MKKTTRTNKLKLSRNTLRKLGGNDLRKVAGGTTGTSFCGQTHQCTQAPPDTNGATARSCFYC